MGGLSVNQFQRIQMNDIPFGEVPVTINVLLYDIDNVDGNMGELCKRSVQKNEKTVRLLRCLFHICFVRNINAVFQSFTCSNRDTFFKKTFSL